MQVPAKSPPIFTDEKGQEFIVAKNGQKQMVEKTKDGKLFVRDEKGQIAMVNAKDQPQVETDPNGNSVVVVDG